MYIGIDIGGTKCAVVYADDSGAVVKKIKFPTTSCEETLKNIFDAVAEMGECRSIGVSCGGPLDEQRGIILSPPNLPDWDEVHITDMLTERFGVPARICNDANACALAEWRFGAGRGTKNMVFLTFGTGLGAGLILDGRLYSGTNGNAGEVGHVRLEKDGPVGYGKAGSFEGFCSGGGIARLGKQAAARALAEGRAMSFCKNADEIEGIDTKLLAEAANSGDEVALEVFRESGRRLGMGLSMIIDILNPEVIVIGSVFARSGHLLRAEMEKVIDTEALAPSAAVCRIVPAELGDEIGDFAAVAVAMGG